MPDRALPAFDGPVYVLSDAHLGVAPAEQEQLLWSWLRFVARQAPAERGAPGTPSVILNGDIFEFWFEWKHVVPQVGVRVLAELAALTERGIPVTWIKGNHDCWGGPTLTRQSGARFIDGPLVARLAGWTTHITHGDGLRPRLDRGYRALRAVLRHPVSVRLFRLLHPDWGAALARATSHTSRHMRPGDGGEGLRNVAQEMLAADPSLDLVIFGHTHLAALERQASTQGMYANPGAWMDTPTYLKITTERVALCEWDGSRETVKASIERDPTPASVTGS